MIELLPVSTLLLRAALEDGWLEDVETNRLMGWGSGANGLDAATHAFLALEPDMLGIYDGTDPIGWVAARGDGPGSCKIMLFIRTRSRRQGLGRQVVWRVLEQAFKQDAVRRVGATVAEINNPARSFFRACGFKREGKRWAALEVDGKVCDAESLVVTRPAWEQLQKEV